MNVIHPSFPATARGVFVAEETADLDTFCAPDCAALIWRRNLPQDLRQWVAAVPETRLPRGRIMLRPEAVAQALEQLCEIYDTPVSVQRDALIAEMVHVCRAFTQLHQARFLRLRLEVVTTNACRKFHIDALPSRLVCTYRGTGTQYGNAEPGCDPARVFTVATGDPILLRGKLWRETPFAGLLHRSPPIEGTGETRLVLVIDPVDDPEEM
ncbi:MAG: DUF1826 domain-containing protein [Pseudomonadota bacterium]